MSGRLVTIHDYSLATGQLSPQKVVIRHVSDQNADYAADRLKRGAESYTNKPGTFNRSLLPKPYPPTGWNNELSGGISEPSHSMRTSK